MEQIAIGIALTRHAIPLGDAYDLGMTALMEEVLRRVRELPEQRQDELAWVLLDELKSDEAWDRLFADSAEQLERVANDVLERHRRGESVEAGWDEL